MLAAAYMIKQVTHAGTVFVTHDLDFRPFDPKINGFPGFIVEQFVSQVW